MFSKFALLRSHIWKRGTFALFVRISAMQINRFTKIVIFVTSLGFTFLSCIALFIFYFYLALLLLLLYSLECAGGFRSCGSDHGLCPLDSHKPLKRLDRNFYMMVLFILCRACGAAAFFGFALIWARLNKK